MTSLAPPVPVRVKEWNLLPDRGGREFHSLNLPRRCGGRIWLRLRRTMLVGFEVMRDMAIARDAESILRRDAEAETPRLRRRRRAAELIPAETPGLARQRN